MKTKVVISKEFCQMDAIKYVAGRYGTTAERVLEHYLMQTGVIRQDFNGSEEDFDLEPNEVALFRDLGVQPSAVEIQ